MAPVGLEGRGSNEAAARLRDGVGGRRIPYLRWLRWTLSRRVVPLQPLFPRTIDGR